MGYRASGRCDSLLHMKRMFIVAHIAALIFMGWNPMMSVATSDDLVEEINRKVRSIRSYTCEMEIEKKGVVISKGRVWFKSSPPRKKSATVVSGMKWVSLQNGDGEISYSSNQKLVFIDKGKAIKPTNDAGGVAAIQSLYGPC